MNLDEYELHAGELRNAKKPRASAPASARSSVWATVPRDQRLALLAEAYQEVAGFQSSDPELPLVLFGVAVDASFRPSDAQVARERFAYEVLLNKFDVMLKNTRIARNRPNRGLVIHDHRVVAERDIQSWTAGWRETAGDVGQLRNLADVPLFADSRATRLLQVADLVSYAVFRRYSPEVGDHAYFDTLLPAFHTENGTLHGCVHYTPSFGQGSCTCTPCEQRLIAEGPGSSRRRGAGSRRR